MAHKRRTNRRTTTSSRSQQTTRHAPGPSKRYTPPAAAFRLRPRWHRFAGWAGILLGLAIAVLNDAMLMGEDLNLLPGGHSEAYLILGVLVAGASTWFLGLFDRGTTIYD